MSTPGDSDQPEDGGGLVSRMQQELWEGTDAEGCGMTSNGGQIPKYAPAREDGLKPWCVELREWGERRERIEWAPSRSQAEYQVKGRMRYVSAKARRATPEDVERLSV